MDIIIIILAIIIILTLIILGGMVWQTQRELKKYQEDSSLQYLKQDIDTMRKEMGEGIWKTAEINQRQFQQSSNIIQQVTERLTKLDETNKQVLNFSKQLESLQDTLKNPKQRGIFGEYYLEILLKNAFNPKQYQCQYYFEDGTAVDAALFFGEKIIPIDSKFSLETYNKMNEEKDIVQKKTLEKQFIRDLKNRIEATAKYIRPQEGTVEFAFMFIPAEGIYYDLLVNKIGTGKAGSRDLIDYAVYEKNVHIVSPTTFYVTLQSLWQGMRAYQIQEKTKDIIKNIAMLSKHLKVYDNHMYRLGSQIGTTVKTYNTASQELKKIDKDIIKLTGKSPNIKKMQIEEPRNEK